MNDKVAEIRKAYSLTVAKWNMNSLPRTQYWY